MKRTQMAGFLCRSPADATVCMSIDPRSAIINPRRQQYPAKRSSSSHHHHVDHSMVMMDVKYSRLVANSQRFADHLLADQKRSSMAMSTTRSRTDQDYSCRNNINPHNTTTSNLSTSLMPSTTTTTTIGHVFQVVVMRVSLHCQGCAGKVKKHLSKMEGVTSFSIDLESKRVTVMGHVSPVGVLESISKVKKAEFWPSK